MTENISKMTEALYGSLISKNSRNSNLRKYYDGDKPVDDLGKITPPGFKNLTEGLGWCQIAIDSLVERINLFSMTAQERADDADGVEPFKDWIEEVVEENDFEGDFEKAAHDFLLYGVSFIMVSRGNPDIGQPKTVITVESPQRVYGEVDSKSGLFTHALRVISHLRAEFYTDTYTYVLSRPEPSDPWKVESYVEHGVGQVPIIPLVNRPDSSGWGKSELSKGARKIFDRAQRELLRREIASERYSIPQRYILGVSEDDFGGAGIAQSVLSDSAIILDDKDTGSLEGGSSANDRATIGTLSPSNPENFIKPFAEDRAEFANVCSIPESYMGIQHSNPSSADAIRMAESRLIKKAEKRIKTLEAGLKRLLRLLSKYYDGVVPEAWVPVVSFHKPHTHTEAASADAVVKLVQAGILPKTHRLTLLRLGYGEAEIKSIQDAAIQEEASILQSLIRETSILDDPTIPSIEVE